MTKSKIRLLAPVLVSLFLPCALQAAEKPIAIYTDKTAFAQALKTAAKIEHDETAEKYRKEKLYPYFGRKYGPATQDCFKKTAQPSSDAFTFVLSLDAGGKVLKINLDNPTNIAVCLLGTVARDTLPPPPFAPFAEKFDMKIAP